MFRLVRSVISRPQTHMWVSKKAVNEVIQGASPEGLIRAAKIGRSRRRHATSLGAGCRRGFRGGSLPAVVEPWPAAPAL